MWVTEVWISGGYEIWVLVELMQAENNGWFHTGNYRLM